MNTIENCIIELAKLSTVLNKDTTLDHMSHDILKNKIKILIETPIDNTYEVKDCEYKKKEYFIINLKSSDEKASNIKNISQISIQKFIDSLKDILNEFKKPKKTLKTDKIDINDLLYKLPTNDDVNMCLDRIQIELEIKKLRLEIKKLTNQLEKDKKLDDIDALEIKLEEIDNSKIDFIENCILHFFKSGIQAAILCYPYDSLKGVVKVFPNFLHHKKEILYGKRTIYLYKISYLDICNLPELEISSFINISKLLKPLWNEKLDDYQQLINFKKLFKFPINGRNSQINNIYELYLELKYYIDKISEAIVELEKTKIIQFKIDNNNEELLIIKREDPSEQINPPEDLPIDTVVEYDLTRYTFFKIAEDFNNPKFNYNPNDRKVTDQNLLIKIPFIGKVRENITNKYGIFHENGPKLKEVERKYVRLTKKELNDYPSVWETKLRGLISNNPLKLNGLNKDLLVKYTITKDWTRKDYIGRISDDLVNIMPNIYNIDSSNKIEFTYYIVQHKNKKYAVLRRSISVIPSGNITDAP